MGNNKKICIIGAGGFGRETLLCIKDDIATKGFKIEDTACFLVEDGNMTNNVLMGVDVISQSNFDSELYSFVVAIGDPPTRKKLSLEVRPRQMS